MTDDDDRANERRDPDALEADDAEGQALTWRVKRPNPEATSDEDDAEGHSPPFKRRLPDLPAVDEDDDTGGHGGPPRTSRTPGD